MLEYLVASVIVLQALEPKLDPSVDQAPKVLTGSVERLSGKLSEDFIDEAAAYQPCLLHIILTDTFFRVKPEAYKRRWSKAIMDNFLWTDKKMLKSIEDLAWNKYGVDLTGKYSK